MNQFQTMAQLGARMSLLESAVAALTSTNPRQRSDVENILTGIVNLPDIPGAPEDINAAVLAAVTIFRARLLETPMADNTMWDDLFRLSAGLSLVQRAIAELTADDPAMRQRVARLVAADETTPKPDSISDEAWKNTLRAAAQFRQKLLNTPMRPKSE